MLTLKLLGKPQAILDGVPVSGFISAKAQALLFYLAVTGRIHPRESLAGLLWSDVPDVQASKNLRNVLSNLRTLVGSHLVITREDAAFNRESAYLLDVEAFLAFFDSDVSKKNIATLHKAVELYQGDFMDGFRITDALAFEEWCAGRQSTLKGLMLQALHTLVAKHLERGEYAAGIDYANRLLAIEPWREEAHRHLMILLARSRQRSAALAQYEKCRRALMDELGVQPMPETTVLYERIKAAVAPPPHNLPPQPTPFIGREAELAEIASYLNDPQAQLLTLVGSGGIGKTRLALQAALHCVEPEANVEQRFADGVFFVPLVSEGVGVADESRSSLIAAMADALGFNFQGPVHPQAQMLNYLREKSLLLIVDNFEPLLTSARQMADILRLAPKVKLIVTSRVRLSLHEERLLEVKGLEYPTETDMPTEPAMEYSAVVLFVQQARRVQSGFTLMPDDVPSVIRICQLMEGLPLCIELAASWLRTLSCREVLSEIKKGLDFLTTPVQNMPERHRSLRAVFDYSWNLLAVEEQMIFRQLSVFRGGFQREAAVQIVGISLPMLAGLVDKSLLRRNASGRYEMHDLLRQYAEEKMRFFPSEDDNVRNLHCRYYAELISRHKAALQGEDLPAALKVLEEERENVRAAWNWAVSCRRVDEVNLFMECL